MTAGKAVALFVAWFALTVVLTKVGVTVILSFGLPLVYMPIIRYQLFVNSASFFGFYATVLFTNAVLFILAVVLPIAIVAWQRERIYSLLGGDLTNVRRGLVLLAAWVALAIPATLSSPATYIITEVAFGLLFEVVGNVNYRTESLLTSLTTGVITGAITLILPLVLVVWNRRVIYDLLRVDSWFGAKSE